MFLSKICLKDLGIISEQFPQPYVNTEVVGMVTEEDEAEVICGCPRRTSVPDPPAVLPFKPTEENVGKLKEYVLKYYANSTMSMCAHQALPKAAGPPMEITSKEGVTPTAIHTPAVIPLHWHDQVKKQLDGDVELGIIKPVEANEPVKWQHRMVVVRKNNGAPRRTADIKANQPSGPMQDGPGLSIETFQMRSVRVSRVGGNNWLT